MKDAWVEANFHAETSKAFGATEQKYQKLIVKLTVEERGWKSVEAGLKNA